MIPKYLDCYLQKNDKPGFPTQTLVVDDPEIELQPILNMLRKYFDRIELVNFTNGQSPIPLTHYLSQNPSFLG